MWCCKDGQNEVLSWMCGVAKMDRMRCRVGCQGKEPRQRVVAGCKDGQNEVLSWMCGVAKMDRMGC